MPSISSVEIVPSFIFLAIPIKKFIASGGKIAPEITTALDDAKKVLLKAGVPEKEADDYLAISVANAIPESGIIPKGSKA